VAHIDHEYHVQDLLYFPSGPGCFSDLKDEEILPLPWPESSHEPTFFIPSIKLIIEVEVPASEPIGSQKVIDELGLRREPLTSPRGQTTRALLPSSGTISRRNEEHSLLQDGLRQIRGVLGAVIVSRPGRMVSLIVTSKNMRPPRHAHLFLSGLGTPSENHLTGATGAGTEARGALDRLFDAFYTTKAPAAWGIGLSICRSIIEAHGGPRMGHAKTHPRGATFQFTLPQRGVTAS